MKKIKVTKLEKQVLETLASLMYAELGFSDVNFEYLQEETKLEKSTLTGVLVSLSNKGYIFTDEEYKDSSDNTIFYLGDDMQGLVEEWVTESKSIFNESMWLQKVELVS